MATAKYSKGTVFAAADPWVYNEYTDGRNLPAEYEGSLRDRGIKDETGEEIRRAK
jgi:hypothetical protein